MPAGIAQHKRIATPTRNEMAKELYHDFHANFFFSHHQGAVNASGNSCKRMVGPFASSPPAKAMVKYK